MRRITVLHPRQRHRSLTVVRTRAFRALDSGAAYAVLALLAVFFFGPLVWMVITSLRAKPDLYSFSIVPRPANWANYYFALTTIPFVQQLKNTVIIAVLNLVGQVLSSSLVAYGFARLSSPYKNPLFALVLATMMIPATATLIPSYILFKYLGWIDTFLPLTVPAFFGHPFNIFLLRVFYQGLPIDLDEAAKIDGASAFRVWWSIILPLSKPVLTTIAIFTFQNTWNDFLGPLIYLQSTDKFTLQLGLASFSGMYSIDWVSVMAAAAVIMLPPATLFAFAQRYFTQSLAFTGLRE